MKKIVGNYRKVFMKGIWAKNKINEMNSKVFFQAKCQKADRLEICALDFYHIYIDGELLGYGPAKTAKGYVRKDVYDVSDKKDFVITVEVVCYNSNAHGVESASPLFAMNAYKDGAIVLDSNDFICYEAKDTVRKTQKYSYQRGAFNEQYVMERDRKEFYLGNGMFPILKTKTVPMPKVLERGVDYLSYGKAKSTLIESGKISINKDAQKWYEEWQMENNPNLNVCFPKSEIQDFVSDTVSEFVFTKSAKNKKVLKDKDYSAYDFNAIKVGFIGLKVNVVEDAVLYVLWSEHADFSKGQCDIEFFRNTCCDIIKYTLKKGEYDISSFEPYCLKYAKVVCLSGQVVVNDLYITKIENKNVDRLVFECENKNLENIVKASQNGLAHNAVDIFTDCPGRERAGWLCDSFFMGKSEKALFNNNKVERNFLENYLLPKEFEGYPDGMIPMCYPSNVLGRKFIPNWAMWFVIELNDYYLRTGDLSLIKKAKKRVYGIIEYFKKFENEDGLLEKLEGWVFVEWSKANDFIEGVNYPTNMLYSEMLLSASKLYKDEELGKKAKKLKTTIGERAFNGEFFVDNAIKNEEGKLINTDNTSETCQYYALLFDIANDEKFNTYKKVMVSKFGHYRDDKKVYPKVYKSNAFIGNYLRLLYLLKSKEYALVLKECEEYFTTMANTTCTMWEYDTPINSLDHGFASFAASLILESISKSDLYEYKAYFRDSFETYNIFAETPEKECKIKKGETIVLNFPEKLDGTKNYCLRLDGEVDFMYQRRFERILPMYYRKLDDSITLTKDGKILNFNEENEVKERTCYCMLRDGFKSHDRIKMSIRSKIRGLKGDFKLTAEIYYGEPKTRFYYQRADEIFTIDLQNSTQFTNYETEFILKDDVDFIMIKIDATKFTGEAQLYAPKLIKTANNENLCYDFDYLPDDLENSRWIGEGFSTVERPKYTVYANGIKIFEGRYMDRLQRFAGANFDIPSNTLKEKDNEFEIKYYEKNIKSYVLRKAQLISKPKTFELLGVKGKAFVGKQFGVFAYIEDGVPKVKKSEYFDYLGFERADKKYGVLKFKAKKEGFNIPITASYSGLEKKIILGSISKKQQEFIITGTGDFIYVNQSMEEFAEYLAWYLRNDIGDLLTFRCVYHWGGTNEINMKFWKTATKLLNSLGIYYSLMHDGRELNGLNSSPDDEDIASPYYLGQQTHERDGAYIYWDQDVDRINEFYYHLLSRKMKHNGIYGKRSPAYDKKGNPKIYYAPDNAKDVKEAYENLKVNLGYTGMDGAKRHTGVSTMFRTFFEAGYKWIGYESMYGPHELMLGAMRGTSNAYNHNIFGTHLALQWSSIPTDEVKHFLRYKLSLYLSYMHGVSEINTEEGLWRIENPFVDFNNFSYSCIRHREEQRAFNKFIQTHNRRGTLKANIAMLIGKYDGMEGFSSPCVFGQAKWKYDKPEESWNLVKVFYPESDINAIYYYIRRGGAKNMPLKDKELLEVRKGMYRDTIGYKQVGWYTNTPYGVIDMIPVDAGDFSKYKCLFFTGWNTADESQVKRLCEFVEGGGKLVLAKPHLYTTVNREEALKGKSEIVDSPYTKKLLEYAETGKVVYYDKDKYPIDYAEDYERDLRELASTYSNKYIRNTKYLSFTEYECSDKTEVFYLLNINWWDCSDATYDFRIANHTFNERIEGCNIRVITVKNNTAVYTSNEFIDVVSVSKNKVVLNGNGQTDLIVLNESGKTVYTVSVDGKTTVKIK
ncbi:MAG: hypothetical protein MJ066_01745 [Clostridia bacterium]|nr:hypothetical protein [Clostridia bacterium]